MSKKTKNNPNLQISKDGGFTIVEIIVVVAITALLTGFLVSYSRRNEVQILLGVEKAKIAQTILYVKSLALAGFTKPPSSPPPCSYGLYFDYVDETYSYFEYTPPPPATCEDIYSVSPITSDPNYFHVSSTTSLESKLDFGAGGQRLGFLVFVPPDPSVIMFDENRNVFLDGPMNIYLKTKDGQNSTTLKVNNLTGQLTF